MIHTENICPKCMKYQENLSFPCPNCGFQGIDEITGIPWEDFTLLEGRYLVGTAVSKEDDSIQYIALDFIENKTVKIQYKEIGFKIIDFVTESKAPSNEFLQKKVPSQKKASSTRIFLAIASVIILLIFGQSIMPLIGFPLIGGTSDDKTALQAKLENLGTPMDDGSIWLPVRKIVYKAQILSLDEDTYELGTWEGPYEEEPWRYGFDRNGTSTITEDYYLTSDDIGTYAYNTTVSTYDEKGRLFELETLWKGQTSYTAKYSYGKDNRIQSSHVTNVIDFETGEEVSGTVQYEYRKVSDGEYEIVLRPEDNASSYEIQRYDKNENCIYYAFIEVSDDEESIVHEIFYEYNDAGNITIASSSDHNGDTSIFHDYQYSYIYNSDGSIAKKIGTDDDGNITITEYTYDEHSNLLTEYTYADRWVSGLRTNNTFSFYIYEKFQLENGVYLATGERTDDYIPELPELKMPE